MNSSRWLVTSLVLGCQPQAVAPIRYVVSYVAHRCDNQVEDEGIKPRVVAGRDKLVELLRQTIEADTKQDLLDVVAEDDPRPLSIFFAGHGANLPGAGPGAPERSAICYSDGPLLVDELLASIHPRVASATVVLDSCWSAREDVRKSRVPVAVLSAADRPIKADSEATALGLYLMDALTQGDANHDQIIDDRELLSGLFVKARGKLPLEARVRRQSFSALPVMAGRRASTPGDWLDQSTITGPGKSNVLERERAFRRLELGKIAREPGVFWAHDPASSSVWTDTKARLDGRLSELRAFARKVSASEGFLLSHSGGEVSVLALRDGEVRTTAPAAELQALAARLARGAWATPNDTGGVWATGYLGNRVGALDGTWIDGHALCPTLCVDPFGQCFERRAVGLCP
jgi:hypothetical protein